VKRTEHPLLILTVDRLARAIDLEPQQLWDAVDGKPTPAWIVDRLVDAYYPGLRREDFVVDESLPSPPKNGTLRTMSATTFAPTRRGRPMQNRNHPLMEALFKAGVTVLEEAKTVGYSPASIRSFCYAKGDPSARPIPRDLAEHWKKTRGVPLSAWPNKKD
jgi:hypothetical protein